MSQACLLITVFILGSWFGIFIMALVSAARDRREDERVRFRKA